MTTLDQPRVPAAPAASSAPAAPSAPASVPASVPAAAPAPVASPSHAPSRTSPEAVRRRVLAAKHAFSTRSVAAHVRASSAPALITGGRAPRPGDVVLARVTRIGQHKRLESPVSRRQTLFVGDEIVVAYGSRYAADQFLARIPDDLGPCHLAAAGGLASRVEAQHAAVSGATEIEPLGVLADEGGPLSLERTASHQVVRGITGRNARPGRQVPVIAVLGTSMNSGKTTLLAQLAHGLAAAGLRVGAGKATGTGAGNDYGLFLDAGAQQVMDFTDFGLSSTFELGFEEIRDLFGSMVDELAGGARPVDVVLIEVADGLFQEETSRLLQDDSFAEVVDGVAFAAGDALGAVGGVQALTATGRAPMLVSGLLTASPIASAEARRLLEVPVVDTPALADPQVARDLVAALLADAAPAADAAAPVGAPDDAPDDAPVDAPRADRRGHGL